ncbi:MAG: tetratricopeptide repeat protein [Bacteroidia bacterium]|nr:tetratricopeptide repeat protein [Bacteroidia bacterium]
MPRFTICLCIIVLCWSDSLPAQDVADTRLDSMRQAIRQMPFGPAQVKACNDLSWEYVRVNADSARRYAWQAWQDAARLRLPGEQAHACKTLGMAAYNENCLDDAECLYREADSIFTSLQDTAGRLAIINNLGLILRLQGRCEELSHHYLAGMHMARLTGAIQKEHIIWFNYFQSLISCMAFEVAQETGDSLLVQARTHNNELMVGHLLSQLGYIHYKAARDSLALRHLQEAERIAVALGEPGLLSSVYNNLGNVYEGLDEYDKAYFYFRESLRIDEQRPYQTQVNNSYHNIGLALWHMKRYDEAIPYLERSLAGNEEEGNLTFLADGHFTLAQAYQAVGRYREAAEHYNQCIELRDTLFSESSLRTIQELRQQYETEKVARELAQTRLDMQAREADNDRLIGGLTGSLLAILAIAAIAMTAIRRRQAEEGRRRVELEYQVLRAQMNPHFIFNALNSIQGFFSERDFAQGNEFLGEFSQLMRRVLEQSAQPLISLADELETLQLYMRLEQVRLRDKFYFEIRCDDDLDTSMISIPPLLLQPFVENAIWHGLSPKQGPGTLIITCETPAETEDWLRVEITDDGIGLDAARRPVKAQQHTSRGIAITRERLGPGGVVRVEPRTDGPGTRVILEIPIPG